MKDGGPLFKEEFFEDVNCNLCGAGSGDAEVLYKPDAKKVPATRDDFIRVYSSSSTNIFYERVVRCLRCGLIYVSPRPRRELILGGYSSSVDEQYVSQERGRLLTFRSCLKILRPVAPKGRLLDIGAASGIFVKAASDAGYEAIGVEPSRWMCGVARERYGVTILPGVLEDAKFKDESFDIVTMWDVLEHVPDPMGTLKEVRRILKPDGFLIVNYPRIDDRLARAFGRRWWFLLSVHLYYFTPKTLSAYLEKVGFEVVAHRPHFQKLAYSYLVERLSVYSGGLAGIAKALFLIPGFRDLLIPYFASQYLMISKKAP